MKLKLNFLKLIALIIIVACIIWAFIYPDQVGEVAAVVIGTLWLTYICDGFENY